MGNLLEFVQNYGYWAVFILVFLQEIGVPNPVPNELILLFGGALTSIGDLNFWLVFLLAVTADALGTTILFTVFYFFEHFIMERLKNWRSINEKLEKIKARLIRHDKWGIFLGRLMPYLRGYVSAVAGILNMPYRVFVPIVILSATLWSGGYVVLGHFLGKKWETVAGFVTRHESTLLTILILVAVFWIYVKHRKKQENEVKSNDDKQSV